MAFLVPRLLHTHFAKDATIVAAHTGPVTHLHIVQRGLVGSRPNNAQADPDRMLGPGELFPVGALSAGGTTTKVFSALKDTHCYLLARDDFLKLRQASPEFERYCTQAITETLKQSLESLYGQYSQRAAEQQLLTRTLAELVRHAPIACPATVTLREAAQRMADAKVRTIIALDRDEAPVGIFTLVDLLRRVVLPGRLLDAPLAEVMTAPLVTLPASATALGSDARDGRARHPPDRRRRQRPIVRRDQRARSVRVAAGLVASGERTAARCRDDRCAASARARTSAA